MPVKNPLQLDRPVKITISYTHTCNLGCKHCYADCNKSGARQELGTGDWIDFIDEIAASGIMSILFEGGECLGKDGFLEVLEHASKKMLTRVRTNGTLVTPELAGELKRCNVGTVLVDFMGATAATHDWFTEQAGSFAKAVRATTHLLDAGIETNTLIIFNRKNCPEVQSFLDLSYDLGVRCSGVLRLYPIGRAKQRWRELALSIDEMQSVIESLRVPDDFKLMQSWHPKDGNCCWQLSAVNAYGDSVGCVYLRELVNYGNVKEVPFLTTWDHPLYEQLRRGEVERDCPDCSSTQRSCGGCRSTAYAFHGRWSAPDPFDIKLNDGVDLRELPEWMLSEGSQSQRPAGS